MRIKHKSALLISTILAILIGFLAYIQISLSNQEKFFQEVTNANESHLINSILQIQIDNFNKLVYNLGSRNGTNNIIVNFDQAWAKNNLDNLFETFKIDYIWLYDLNGKEIYRTQNESKPKELSSIENFELLKQQIFKDRVVHYYVSFQNKIYEISASCIKRENETTIRGIVVGARIIDKTYLTDLRFLSSYPMALNLHPYENQDVFFALKLNNLTKENIASLTFTNAETRNNLSKNSSFTRDIYLASALTVVLVALIISLFFFIFILPQLKKISKSLKSNNLDELSILLNGKDEFSEISQQLIEFTKHVSELEAQKKLYETMVNFLPDVIAISDKNSIITFISPSVIQSLGYSSEELLGKFIYDLIDPANLAEYSQIKNKLQNNANETFEFQFKTNRKDGSKCWFEARMINLYDNIAIAGVMSLARDITKNKVIEDELVSTKNRLDNILDTINDVIWSAEPKPPYNLIYINKAAEKIFDASITKIYENPNTRDTYIHPEDRYLADLSALMADLKLTGHATTEYRLLMPDGKVKWLFEKVWLAFDQHDQPLRFDGIISEITDRKITEQDLQKTMRSVELARINAMEANKAKTAFLANMSHEIRTPMNGIIGLTDLSLTTDLTDIQRNYLINVKNSAYSLLDIINNILDYSKIEAGKIDIEFIAFNLLEIIEKSINITKIKAHEKGLELLLNIDEDTPKFLVGDPIRIRQILVNLLGNAIKFTDKGEICLSVNAKSIPNNLNYAIINFSVRDTGIGIPQDKIELIFDSFSQADNSTTRKYGGTGLGLAISSNLAQIMGGQIKVDSKYNVGSEFTFSIQLAISQPPADFEQPLDINVKTALIVDDNETNLTILSDMLIRRGVEVDKCSSPFKALELLTTKSKNDEHYDLIVLDMQMPEMDGLSLAENIKYKLNLSKEPIIFMFSSIEKTQIIDRCKGLGIQRFLTKPIKYEDLVHVLENPYAETNSINIDSNLLSSKLTNSRNGNVLVVEDNAINMMIISDALEKLGFTVFKEYDGLKAVDSFKDREYQLVYMDIHMPIMDGFEATAKIREIEGKTSRTPIIALTADAMKGDKEKCLAADMDYYISKPFKHADIIDSINKFLGEDFVKMNSSDNFFIQEKHQISESGNIFDRTEFYERIEGNKELGRLILKEFPKEFVKSKVNLETAINEKDYEKIKFASHLIKGMCGNISAYRLKKLAEKIEFASKTQESLDLIKRNFMKFDPEFEALMIELDRGL